MDNEESKPENIEEKKEGNPEKPLKQKRLFKNVRGYKRFLLFSVSYLLIFLIIR